VIHNVAQEVAELGAVVPVQRVPGLHLPGDRLRLVGVAALELGLEQGQRDGEVHRCGEDDDRGERHGELHRNGQGARE
jgi:hypothetical protein